MIGIGSLVRVKESFTLSNYRGRVCRVTEGNILTGILTVRDMDDRELGFYVYDVDEIEVKDHCSVCNAITPGRTICCECKSK
jgi:hypothetical protein